MLCSEKYWNPRNFSGSCIRDQEKKGQSERGKIDVKSQCEPRKLGLRVGMHYSVNLIYISNKLIKSQ